tara:strand:- start:231 stop:533 length:303 start_codon:yes stop_codon:yes gene_type:complete
MPGDVVRIRDVEGHTATKDWRYLVVGKGKWEGFISAFCFKGEPGWVGKTFSFQINTLRHAGAGAAEHDICTADAGHDTNPCELCNKKLPEKTGANPSLNS